LPEELKTDSDLALPLNPESRLQLLNELTEQTAKSNLASKDRQTLYCIFELIESDLLDFKIFN